MEAGRPAPPAALVLIFPATAPPLGSAVVALAALVFATLPVFAKLTLCERRKKP